MNIPKFEISLYGNPECQPVLILQGNRYTATACYVEMRKIMSEQEIDRHDYFPKAISKITDAVGETTAEHTAEFLHCTPASYSFADDCGFHVLALWLIAKDRELNSECYENEQLFQESVHDENS